MYDDKRYSKTNKMYILLTTYMYVSIYLSLCGTKGIVAIKKLNACLFSDWLCITLHWINMILQIITKCNGPMPAIICNKYVTKIGLVDLSILLQCQNKIQDWIHVFGIIYFKLWNFQTKSIFKSIWPHKSIYKLIFYQIRY